MNGKIIVIEGSDASGKTTQCELLMKKLGEQGYKTAYFHFPDYSTPTGKKVAAYLRGEIGKINEIDTYKTAKLYADDRFAARKKIIDFLNQGVIVVIDRYVLSSKAYHAAKIDDEVEKEKIIYWIDELEYGENKLPKEHLLIYLDTPLSIALEWHKKKGSREYLKGKEDIHESNTEYLRKVEREYLKIVDSNDDYIKIECVIDGKPLSKEEIHDKIWRAFKEVI